jgi:hypothetical protein
LKEIIELSRASLRSAPRAALDHSKDVAALGAPFADQVIHELPHQIDPSAADSDFPGIKMGDSGQIESRSFVEDFHFYTIG